MNCLISHPMVPNKKQNTQITTGKTTIPHRVEKIGKRKWPTATFSKAQVRRRSPIRCWCAAQSSGAPKHPSVVKLLFAGKSATGQVFLAMEYVPSDLTREIHKTLDMNAIRSCAQGLFSGLQALYLRDIIHSDIKPQNLLAEGLAPPPSEGSPTLTHLSCSATASGVEQPRFGLMAPW